MRYHFQFKALVIEIAKGLVWHRYLLTNPGKQDLSSFFVWIFIFNNYIKKIEIQ